MNQPLITIVTICYNISGELGKTMQSVINQTYDNIEYIIVDGGSSDNSVDIIKNHGKIAIGKGMLFKWVSEPDKGIYDAMNKGIGLATGKWINFMNGGDGFYSNDTVKEIFDSQLYEAEVIYGDVVLDYVSFIEKLKAKNLSRLWQGMVFCHQSAFIDREYHKKNKYSLQYSISGDFDFFYSISKKKAKFQYVEKIISVFACNGVSSKNGCKEIIQNYRIVNQNFSIKHILYYSYLYLRHVIGNTAKMLLTKKLVHSIKDLL